MYSSRKLEDLTEATRKAVSRMVEECRLEGIEILITCTYRDCEAQNNLYAQGRTVKGAVVTNCRGGESSHQKRTAVDVVPMRHGKCVWGTSGADLVLWRKVGAIGEACGLVWSGRWMGKLREYPHFEMRGLP